jgi:adenylate cyclase
LTTGVRNALIALLIVAGANIAVAPFMDRLGGFSIDTLFLLRDTAFGPRHAPEDSPTVVIAIDEETYRRQPFQNLPKAMWSGEIATVLDSLLKGGARVIGFDIVLPTSVEPKLRGFDRSLLIALREASRSGKVVLGKVQHQFRPISPFAGYSFAVGHNRNIRPLNMIEDEDGVLRRLPLFFRSVDLKKGERFEPSMALEIASRVVGTLPESTAAGEAVFNGRTLKYEGAGPMINFDGGAGWIPSYSLADLHACAEKGDSDYFRRHFAGKAVFLGVVLDIEDRKLTSRRFINTPEGIGLPDRCALKPMTGLFREGLVRDSIPGVYMHAAAVNMLLRNELIGEPARWARIAIAAILSLAIVTLAFAMSPVRAAMAGIAVALCWIAATTVSFSYDYALPLWQPFAAAFLSFAVAVGFRFAVADRDKRYLRQAFSLFLPPAVVDQMVESEAPPELGGETRALSVFFSDIQGFTGISEGLSPQELVQFLNRYLSVVTDIIEQHGGFVDKYIGDAVVGVFGAPLDDPDHARHAVEAALACQDKLAEMQSSFGLPGAPVVATRIGINSGDMLVGNIGSSRRFNYTVMGDAVNVAARLEGANKFYGTSILVSEDTRLACGPDAAPLFREIDLLRVVGRDAPVAVYQPGVAETEDFTEALQAYRDGRFADAAAKFDVLARDGDRVAALFGERCRDLVAYPPSDWDGVTVLDRK